MLQDLEDDFYLDQLSINEDSGDNPLGIVIEPSLSDVNEEKLPDITDEPFVNEENKFPINDMGMDMKWFLVVYFPKDNN